MPDLLIEIGLEELPSSCMKDLNDSLKEKFKQFLSEQRWQYQEAKVDLSPRRMVFHIHELSLFQSDLSEKMKGPPVSIALDSQGQATPALKGFLQKCRTDQWQQEDTPQGPYIFANLQREALQVTEFFPKFFPAFLQQFPFKKTMRWENYSFIRPVRWICALYGAKLIPIELFGIKARKYSRGFHGEAEIPVDAAEQYLTLAQAHGWVVSMQERIQYIQARIPVLTGDSPVEENANRTEAPQIVKASFPSQFIHLPVEVIYTVINDQMKCFPAFPITEDKASEGFYFIMNGPKDLTLVRRGFEKVVTARLNDAAYFFEQDQREAFTVRLEHLKNMIFMEKTGSIYDKLDRIKQSLSQLNISNQYPALEQLVNLMKNDLSCSLVAELPELQGTMGRIYALKNGFSQEIALSIEQHYQPRTEQDDLPDQNLAVIAGVLDRMDTLIGALAMNIPFSGSADPFGLRRCMNGLVRLVIDFEMPFSLDDLFSSTWVSYEKSSLNLQKSVNEAKKVFTEWINQRLYAVLTQTYRYDLVQAVLSSQLQNPKILINKLDLLESAKKSPEFQILCESYTRIRNMLKEDLLLDEINTDLMEHPEEKLLYCAWQNSSTQLAKQKNLQPQTLLLLYQLNSPVQAFFEKVFVMSKEEKIKNNRLRLLFEVHQLIHHYFDLSKVVFEGGNSL